MAGPGQQQRRSTAADDIDYEIKGQELQFLEIELDPGESAVAEAGAFVWKDAAIEMTTVFGDGSAAPMAASWASCTVWIQSLPFSRLAGRMLAAAGGRGPDRDEGSLLGGFGRLIDGN